MTDIVDFGSLSRGIAVQARVIGALIVREFHIRFGRNNIGFVWMIVEPALLSVGISVIHFVIVHQPPLGLMVVPFYASGYSCYCLFRSMVNRAGKTMEGNAVLLQHRHISMFDIVFARAVLDTAAFFFAGLIVLVAAAALGVGVIPQRPLLFLEAWGFNAWFCFGIAMWALAGCIKWPVLDRFIHPATYFTLVVSGTFVVSEQIPEPFRDWTAWVPLMQISEIVREGVFKSFTSTAADPPYMITVCLVLTVTGWFALRAMRPKVEL
jgi:capsular polysaccharide transport system permease protein